MIRSYLMYKYFYYGLYVDFNEHVCIIQQLADPPSNNQHQLARNELETNYVYVTFHHWPTLGTCIWVSYFNFIV